MRKLLARDSLLVLDLTLPQLSDKMMGSVFLWDNVRMDGVIMSLEPMLDEEDLTLEEVENRVNAGAVDMSDVAAMFSGGLYFGYDSPEEAVQDCHATSQLEAYCRMMAGENVFISGPAGSGKSSIIKPFISTVEKMYPHIVIAKTGTTGVSALNVNGVTIHSFAGLMSSSFRGMGAMNLAMVDVLIIDEISMLPAYMFDRLNDYAQKARNSKLPFGGIQLILLGDFMQLPPVSSRDEEGSSDYPIVSKAWKNGNIRNLYMDKVHRATDPKLQKVLFEISRGKVSSESMSLLKSRMGENLKDPQKVYTTMFSRNKNIDAYNNKKLEELGNKIFSFDTKEGDNGFSPRQYLNPEDLKTVEKFMSQHRLVEPFRVSVGATVIFTSNTMQAPNGTVARVVSVNPDSIDVVDNKGTRLNVVRVVSVASKKVTSTVTDPKTGKKRTFRDEVELARFYQFPLRLGFAISVHKSQGQTYDGVVIDLRDVFMPGLGYVALSRVRALDDLVITGFKNLAVKVSERSLMISRFVKRDSLKNREEFVDKMSWYVSLMTDEEALNEVWEEKESRASRLNSHRTETIFSWPKFVGTSN